MAIIIGVASVIVMMAVGKGSQERVLAQMNTFGTRTVFVFPRWISERHKPRPLALADVDAIRLLPNVEMASPYAEQVMTVRHGRQDFAVRMGTLGRRG